MNLKKLKTKWEPEKSDIEWVKKFFSMLNDGNYWGFDGGFCQVNKTKKIFKVCQVANGGKENVARCIKVVKMLGYKVVVGNSNTPKMDKIHYFG